MVRPALDTDQPGAADLQISKEVRIWLEARAGWNQEALAHAAGIPKASLSNYLRGLRKWPAAAVLAVSRAMALPVCTLYGQVGARFCPTTGGARLLARLIELWEKNPDGIDLIMIPKDQARDAWSDVARRGGVEPSIWSNLNLNQNSTVAVLRYLARNFETFTDEQQQALIQAADELRELERQGGS